MDIFCLQLRKGSENTKKTRRLSKDKIKKQLVDSIFNNNMVETEELNKMAEEVEKPEDTAAVIKQYEDIIRSKKKGTISTAYHQGKVFKRFKDKERFIELVNEFKVHKSTTIFKINIFKLIEKYPKLMKPSVGLGFLKAITRILSKFQKKIQKSLNKQKSFV